ncbi:hypothetical protein P261_00106 [Lachnospiraceae bacterium TWA4]|nr:hypothetical protein P261_00106 [Lachnospiraceae bacterium TWA4]
MIQDEKIIKAIKVLDDVKIVKDDGNGAYILKSFRGQISSFGALIMTGTLLSAVAFYSSQGGSNVERQKLMKAIYKFIKDDSGDVKDTALLEYVIHNNTVELKKQIIDAAIAIKLGMNAYTLKSDEQKKETDND